MKRNSLSFVHLQVGELTDLEDQWMQQYFDYLAKGGIAEGAKLKIERLPVVMKCEDCGMNYTADIRKDGPIVCPSCSSEKKKLVSGRGVFHQEYGGGLSLINNQI